MRNSRVNEGSFHKDTISSVFWLKFNTIVFFGLELQLAIQFYFTINVLNSAIFGKILHIVISLFTKYNHHYSPKCIFREED